MVLLWRDRQLLGSSCFQLGKLHKRHNALLFHGTCFAIAAGIVRFHHVRGTYNPADILTKHWDYASVREVLKPLLFWHADTAELVKEEDKSLVSTATPPLNKTVSPERAAQERKSAAVLRDITGDVPVMGTQPWGSHMQCENHHTFSHRQWRRLWLFPTT